MRHSAALSICVFSLIALLASTSGAVAIQRLGLSDVLQADTIVVVVRVGAGELTEYPDFTVTTYPVETLRVLRGELSVDLTAARFLWSSPRPVEFDGMLEAPIEDSSGIERELVAATEVILLAHSGPSTDGVLSFFRAEPIEREAEVLELLSGMPPPMPASWSGLDSTLSYHGRPVGAVYIAFAHQLFTTDHAGHFQVSFGNAGETPSELVFDPLTVSGGLMAAPRTIALTLENTNGSAPAPGEAVPELSVDGDRLRLLLEPGQLAGLSVWMPHDLDPSLDQAYRGICYQLATRVTVDDSFGSDLAATFCFGERIPIR